MYAANHRLLCYRKSEGDLPTDGGEPALTNAEYERCARKVEQPTPARPLCAGCFTELPASGRCDYCARSPPAPNDRFQAGCDGVTAPATTTRQVSAPGREAPPEPRTTDGAAPDPRRPPRSGSMSESSSGVTGRASAFSESQISACKLQPISVVQLPGPLQQRSINHTDDATDAPDSTVQAPQPKQDRWTLGLAMRVVARKLSAPCTGSFTPRPAGDGSFSHVIPTRYHVRMTRKASVLAPVLRSETQARLLAAVLLQQDREASIADLARETGSDPGNLHAEVERLVKAGILADRRAGRTRLLRAGDSALIGPLANLLLLGYGPKTAVEQALSGVPGIEQAFVGGSWAARYNGQAGAFPHDVDVIVVGTPNRDDVTEAVVDALHGVGHDGQVIFRTPTAWRQATDAFTRTAKNQPLVALTLGDLHG